jgi:hypothetical protein
MRAASFQTRRIPALILLLPGLGLSQATQPKAILTVKGYAGQAPVTQINGKAYVELESLARLTNGSISFHANQITLTPGVLSVNPPSAVTDPPAKLSKDFLKTEIETMTVIEEWRSAMVNAIQSNQPVTEDWASGYRRNADGKLALASASAGTDPDRNVLLLLRNEFSNMQQLSEKYLALRKSLTYISPDSLDDDPLNQQLVSCARDLASMATTGQFQDVSSCH